MDNFVCPNGDCTCFSATLHGLDILLSLSHRNGSHENNMFKGLKIGHAEQQFQDA